MCTSSLSTASIWNVFHSRKKWARYDRKCILALWSPNDPYRGRTALLTSKRCILYIYSTNIGTEYFKHGIYSPLFSLQNAVCFIILTYLVPVLFTLYIQDVLKFKKSNSGAKRLITEINRCTNVRDWKGMNSHPPLEVLVLWFSTQCVCLCTWCRTKHCDLESRNIYSSFLQ
jgi:hypothetical protein